MSLRAPHTGIVRKCTAAPISTAFRTNELDAVWSGGFSVR